MNTLFRTQFRMTAAGEGVLEYHDLHEDWCYPTHPPHPPRRPNPVASVDTLISSLSRLCIKLSMRATFTTASQPFFAACIMAVTPALFLQSMHLGNRDTMQWTTSSWPSLAASMSGVSPLLFLETPSRSCCSSSTRCCTISRCPFSAAMCREVLPPMSGL